VNHFFKLSQADKSAIGFSNQGDQKHNSRYIAEQWTINSRCFERASHDSEGFNNNSRNIAD